MKGIIFDLDGVIVFTDHFHYLAWKSLADQEGIYFDEVINHRLRGVSRMESLSIILERAEKTYSEEEKVAMATLKNQRYQDYLKTMTYSDVKEKDRQILVHLKESGYKIAVGSSSKNAGFILKQVGLDQLFDAVVDGNHITHSKPHPEVFLKAATALKLPVSECLVVEDAEAGIDAAKTGGFIACGIQQAKDYIKTDVPLTSLSDLAKYLKIA
ncbi:MAG: beta-phosphoglucomutase [Methanomicrobia archaeon]|nr:beta-phosphoglucomutase [Methanomicrobia archaeon]